MSLLDTFAQQPTPTEEDLRSRAPGLVERFVGSFSPMQLLDPLVAAVTGQVGGRPLRWRERLEAASVGLPFVLGMAVPWSRRIRGRVLADDRPLQRAERLRLGLEMPPRSPTPLGEASVPPKYVLIPHDTALLDGSWQAYVPPARPGRPGLPAPGEAGTVPAVVPWDLNDVRAMLVTVPTTARERAALLLDRSVHDPYVHELARVILHSSTLADDPWALPTLRKLVDHAAPGSEFARMWERVLNPTGPRIFTSAAQADEFIRMNEALYDLLPNSAMIRYRGTRTPGGLVAFEPTLELPGGLSVASVNTPEPGQAVILYGYSWSAVPHRRPGTHAEWMDAIDTTGWRQAITEMLNLLVARVQGLGNMDMDAAQSWWSLMRNVGDRAFRASGLPDTPENRRFVAGLLAERLRALRNDVDAASEVLALPNGPLAADLATWQARQQAASGRRTGPRFRLDGYHRSPAVRSLQRAILGEPDAFPVDENLVRLLVDQFLPTHVIGKPDPAWARRTALWQAAGEALQMFRAWLLAAPTLNPRLAGLAQVTPEEVTRQLATDLRALWTQVRVGDTRGTAEEAARQQLAAQLGLPAETGRSPTPLAPATPTFFGAFREQPAWLDWFGFVGDPDRVNVRIASWVPDRFGGVDLSRIADEAGRPPTVRTEAQIAPMHRTFTRHLQFAHKLRFQAVTWTGDADVVGHLASVFDRHGEDWAYVARRAGITFAVNGGSWSGMEQAMFFNRYREWLDSLPEELAFAAEALANETAMVVEEYLRHGGGASDLAGFVRNHFRSPERRHRTLDPAFFVANATWHGLTGPVDETAVYTVGGPAVEMMKQAWNDPRRPDRILRGFEPLYGFGGPIEQAAGGTAQVPGKFVRWGTWTPVATPLDVLDTVWSVLPQITFGPVSTALDFAPWWRVEWEVAMPTPGGRRVTWVTGKGNFMFEHLRKQTGALVVTAADPSVRERVFDDLQIRHVGRAYLFVPDVSRQGLVPSGRRVTAEEIYRADPATLARTLKDIPWGIVSAPERAMHRLAADIRALNLEPVLVTGWWKGDQEQSFLVPYITEGELIRLGRRYNQEAVISNNRLLNLQPNQTVVVQQAGIEWRYVRVTERIPRGVNMPTPAAPDLSGTMPIPADYRPVFKLKLYDPIGNPQPDHVFGQTTGAVTNVRREYLVGHLEFVPWDGTQPLDAWWNRVLEAYEGLDPDWRIPLRQRIMYLGQGTLAPRGLKPYWITDAMYGVERVVFDRGVMIFRTLPDHLVVPNPDDPVSPSVPVWMYDSQPTPVPLVQGAKGDDVLWQAMHMPSTEPVTPELTVAPRVGPFVVLTPTPAMQRAMDIGDPEMQIDFDARDVWYFWWDDFWHGDGRWYVSANDRMANRHEPPDVVWMKRAVGGPALLTTNPVLGGKLRRDLALGRYGVFPVLEDVGGVFTNPASAAGTGYQRRIHIGPEPERKLP